MTSKWAFRAASIVAAAAVTTAALVELPALIHAEAVSRANNGDWPSAQALAIEAVRLDPDMPIYQLTAGLAAAHVGDNAGAAASLRIIAEATNLPEAWLDLAAAEAALGNTATAVDGLHRAMRLGVAQPAIAVAGAELAMDLGERQLAIDSLATTFAGVPYLASDPSWGVRQDLNSLRHEAIASAERLGGPALTWQIAMYSGDYAAAHRAAAELDAEDEEVAGLVISASEGDRGAYVEMSRRCLASPYDQLLRWCASVADRLGTSDAARFRELAAAVGASGQEARLVIDGSGEAPPGTRAPAMLFGIAAFRRATPWDSLVPSLLHVREVEE